MFRKIQDEEIQILDDDPVRPEIPADIRLIYGDIYVLESEGMIDAVLCIMYTNKVPKTNEELIKLAKQAKGGKNGNFAILYTCWSYKKGCGSAIVNDVVKELKENQPEVKRYITLSPLTKMASDFHYKNGASKIRVNKTTQNFEYK